MDGRLPELNEGKHQFVAKIAGLLFFQSYCAAAADSQVCSALKTVAIAI